MHSVIAAKGKNEADRRGRRTSGIISISVTNSGQPALADQEPESGVNCGTIRGNRHTEKLEGQTVTSRSEMSKDYLWNASSVKCRVLFMHKYPLKFQH